MTEVSRKPGTRVIPEKGSIPIIFNFRPTSFEFVGPERHEEWTRLMREHVGMHAVRDFDPCETISGCSGGWDDCDCW